MRRQVCWLSGCPFGIQRHLSPGPTPFRTPQNLPVQSVGESAGTQSFCFPCPAISNPTPG